MGKRAAQPLKNSFQKFKGLCVKLNKAKRKKHLTHNSLFLCQPALDSNGCGTLRFVSVMQYIFLFKKDVLCMMRVVKFLNLRLQYYDTKIQMLSVFSYIKIKSLIRSRATQIVAENSTNSIKTGKWKHLIRKPH